MEGYLITVCRWFVEPGHPVTANGISAVGPCWLDQSGHGPIFTQQLMESLESIEVL
jgi:hypothetical protein